MDPLHELVFVRDGWQCRHCKDRNTLHAHHVRLRSALGPDELNNLITLCLQCHEAFHKDNLAITVLVVQDTNVQVMFVRMNGWRPR